MRRKISLYIAGQLVDLDDDAIILFNYTQEDLSNPTIVKNSFSKQITLKGTKNNNALFGDVFRLDRNTIPSADSQTGANFDPIRKTPFTIYLDTGEIVESGYVKLDNIAKKGEQIEYAVTLYGGLGSFFYALSYNENGDKLSLADIDYLGTSAPDDELTFNINAANVQAAWTALANNATTGKWSVINFAPCYNGIPDQNFSADKGLFVPSSANLADSVVDGEGEEQKTYTLRGGYSLCKLAAKIDEYAAKDFRSYLQRPVFKLRAFLNALTRPQNNGGFSVDFSILNEMSNYVESAWMTLPLLPSLGTYKQTEGSISVERSGDWSTNTNVATYTLSGLDNVVSGTIINARLNLSLRQNSNTGDFATLYNQQYYTEDNNTTSKYLRSVAFIQAVAYDSDNNVVGGSRVDCIGKMGANVNSIQEAAAKFGYTPVYNDDSVWGNNVMTGEWIHLSDNEYKFQYDLSMQVSAANVTYYKVYMTEYHYEAISQKHSGGSSNRRGGTTSWTEANIAGGYSGQMYLHNPEYLTNSTTLTSYLSTGAMIVDGSAPHQITYESSATLRSNAVITKQMLLSSTDTPAQFLLSICKAFGLYMLYDNAMRKVTLVSRNDLYVDKVMDITGRVDLSKPVKVTPFIFDAKWYDFVFPSIGGEFSDVYESIQGRPYGLQRVNTGYEFNSNTTNVMEKVMFKQAVPVLEHNKYWNRITKDSYFYPSGLLDTGAKYTLWDSSYDGKEFDIPNIPADATITYYNSTRPGYDLADAAKLQMHDATGKPLSGEYCLCMLTGWKTYADFKLTDDLPTMDGVNDGVPCWLLGRGAGVTCPIFNKYKIEEYYHYGHHYRMVASLDFGVPKEIDIPDFNGYEESATIYGRAWKRYLQDRYNRDTKIMTCSVNLSGIQVNQNLLRQFFYYDNSLWVLNKITNYSLTTYDPVECEFIKVQSKTNYTNGQTI